MKIGPWEIILIIFVIIAAIVIARIIRGGRISTIEKQNAPREKANKSRSFLRRGGIAFVLIGIILFLAVISMLRWVFQGYIWSFIIIVIGFVMLFLSRKKT